MICRRSYLPVAAEKEKFEIRKPKKPHIEEQSEEIGLTVCKTATADPLFDEVTELCDQAIASEDRGKRIEIFFLLDICDKKI